MNILRRVLVRKPPWPLIAAKPVRLVSSGSPPDELNEDLFWDNLKNSLNLGELTKRAKANQTGAEKRVFVLQLRMQFKSKARQSTTPELQLAESISLVETLRNWKVIDWYIVGMKHSYSKEMFGEGNQVNCWILVLMEVNGRISFVYFRSCCRERLGPRALIVYLSSSTI